MKKFTAILLTLIMSLTFTSTCFAESYYMWESTSGNAQTEVLAHVYSTYTIIIPATINLNENDNCSISISDNNLEEGYQINVYCTNMQDGCIQMHHCQDSDITTYCEILTLDGQHFADNTPIATFTQQELSYGNNIRNFLLALRNEPVKAGDYTGIVEYYFDCSPM